MSDQSPPKKTIPCPEWAASLLDKLQRLEVKLGNVQEPEHSGDSDSGSTSGPAGWHSRSVDDLVAAAANDSSDTYTPTQTDDGAADLAEAIFDRVCAGLAEEGRSHQEIADVINSRVGAGGRMKYCDAADVAEALEA